VLKADHISGFHANTHIPIVIGAQMRYEITGDELYKVSGLLVLPLYSQTEWWTDLQFDRTETGTFFLDVVGSTHSFAIEGISRYDTMTIPVVSSGMQIQTNTQVVNIYFYSFWWILDDCLEFASLQAILYGPNLLAGFSKGDYDIQTGPTKSTSDWITPIPNECNSHLVSLIQRTREKSYSSWTRTK